MEKIDNHAASRDVALREGAPPVSRPLDHSRHTPSANNGPAGPERIPSESWTSAISRLQAQVSYNTGMLESHRRQFTDIEAALSRLHQEMASMLGMIDNVRGEMRSRPANQEGPRIDPADADVLTGQLQTLTNKLHEVDGLAFQMNMMKNRMKRLEEEAPLVPTSNHRPATSTRREHPNHEVPPPPQPSGPPIAHHSAQRPLPSTQHPPLPPMRTGSIPSPQTNRAPSFPTPHAPESQGVHSHHPPSESRRFSGDPASAPHHPPPAPPGAPGPGYRPGEPLPPPSAISGWRPADAYPPSGLSPANAPATARGHPLETDSQNSHTSGWATVNTNTAIKRPPEEGRSPYGSPLGDSSKRPKLAPLMPNMPRSNYSDEGFVPSQSNFHSVPSNLSEGSQQPRSRAPSDGSQPQSHPTPASTLQHSFRFITSTQQTDPQEPWRPESQRESAPPAHGNSRGGRGGRGRGRGRGGRGRGASHAHGGHHEAQEIGTTPEWERPEWSGGRTSPNGCHNHMHHPHSPRLASRGGIVRRADALVAGPGERHSDYPVTPVQPPPPDPYAAPPDAAMSSSGKKTRTKPIRNAEGILIRKDGRPDMRSVSSANNLRKVHAKKEAERAEMEEDGDGLTRSGTPTSAAAGENDISDETPDNSQERQNQLVSRLITQGQGGMEGRRVAEQFFPQHQEDPLSAAPRMKAERDGEIESQSREQSSQAVDVVMKEADEAPAEQQFERSADQDKAASEPRAQQDSPAPSKNGSNIVVQPAAAAA